MSCPLVCNMSNTAGATCGAGTAYLSRAPGAIPPNRVARCLVFCAMFYRSLVELLDTTMHVKAIAYPFDNVKLLFSD